MSRIGGKRHLNDWNVSLPIHIKVHPLVGGYVAIHHIQNFLWVTYVKAVDFRILKPVKAEGMANVNSYNDGDLYNVLTKLSTMHFTKAMCK